jgi:glucose/mannose-6-phosphate isomerase
VTVLLDDPTTYAAVDADDALGVTESTAERWAAAVPAARAAGGLPSGDGVTSIVVCGMGGSGIAGDVLAMVAAERGRVPVTVTKGYELPAFIGPDTLVIAASYSGNTEETLACVDDAVRRRARIVAITTGGTLASKADQHGFSVVAIPAGYQPRAALATLAATTLVIAERLGALPDLSADLAEAGEVLRAGCAALGRDVPEERNPAKRLARALTDRPSLIWGQDGPLAVAALRWRCQLNENAKVPAFSAVLPELDHNELVGYDPGVSALRDLVLIVLRAPDEHPRVGRRIEVTLDEMGERVAAVHEAWGTGSSASARFMSTALVGDFTSIYLALLRGVDPTPVEVIERLKKRLSD